MNLALKSMDLRKIGKNQILNKMGVTP